MSQASTSLELSEFFNNDDSDGNRLAEFLQERRGGIQKQKFLYINGEPDRLSLNVQLEKLPDLPREATNSKENGKNEDAVSKCENQNNKSTKSNENSISKIPENQNEQPIQPVSPLATGEPESPLSIRNLKHHTPLISSVLKSCGFISPSDRLRRYSMKRLKVASGGRRTLLKEFESTIDKNFDPLISSTPYSHPQQEKRRSANSSLPLVLQNDRPLPQESSKDDVCSRKELSVLINSLQNKTQIGKKNQSILEKTVKTQNQNVLNENTMGKRKSNSSLIIEGMPSLKRTFTAAEGNLSKDISTDKNTHGRTRSSSAAILLALQDEQIGSQKIRASRRSTSMHSIHMNSKRDQHQEIESSNLRAEELPECNESVVQASKIIGVTETQNTRENSIIILADRTIVIPIKQTINSTCRQEIQKNAVEETKTKQHIDNLHIERMQQTVSSNAVDTNRAEDKLQLTDILTEDEETPQSASLLGAKNNSEGPVNLAAKRLKKRSSLRQAHTSRIYNFENETEKSSAKTRTYNRRVKEIHRPLNSAPGFPINGEQFAADLKRMSNYEILDLRKRNSKGQIFTISGHKSRRLQEDVAKKQNFLDSQIEKELLKRSMKEVVEKEVAQSDNCQENEINENLPVPDKFSESLTNQQEISNDSTKLLPVDPENMVSFKNKDSEKTKKSKNRGVTEELKQYLRVTKSFSKKKRKISDNAKRSLYTPGLSDSEENCSKTEKRSLVNESAVNSLTTRKVVLPTPTLEAKKRRNHQVVTNQHEQKSHETTTTVHITPDSPISSQGFEINSSVGCNIENSNHPNITNTFLAAKTTTNLNTHEKQDEIFKKPNKPPPKVRRGRNRELEKLMSNNSQDYIAEERNSSTDSTNDVLRRSKRAHVPVSYPIVEELHQRAFNKYLKRAKNINDGKLKESVSKIKPAKSNKVQKKPLTTNNNRKIKPNENVNCDDLLSTTPENIDQMQNSNSTTKMPTARPVLPLKIKPFKVRVARLKTVSPTNDNFSSVSSISSDIRADSSSELISWLKNIKGNDSYTTSNNNFNFMKLAAASDVFFTEAQGLDYAFYDTHEDIHLGYLRFKPRQIKPKKRASNCCLRFIALNGNFRVTANNEESRIGVGDMIVIEKSVLYEIENLNEDFGILMVFKN